MKQMRLSFYAAMMLLALSVACAPAGSADGALLSADAQQATQSGIPTPTDMGAAIALQSITVAHPPMQVGSIERYFDGALLDAVPNGGPFVMGGTGADNLQHKVTVSDFWIYGTEVSNQMYAWCVSLGKCSPPNAQDAVNYSNPKFANYPVVGVNWGQASDYCGFVNGRLPTEAEWEKAASWDAALKQQRIYPWGDHDPSCDLLNFKYCLGKATSVVSFGQGQSFYGAYNMEGNVYEWVGDWFGRNYYSTSPSTDPAGPDTGSMRVMRSSGYNADAMYASPNWRSSADPGDHRPDLGFRCVVKDPAHFAPFCIAPISYGVDPSGTPAADKPCADPTILHAESCGAGSTPLQIVTVRNNAPTTVTVTGLDSCDPANNDVGVPHTCAPGVTIQVHATCDILPAGQPACPPDFTRDPNNPTQCTSPGGPGACPTGFAYDSKLQCCSAAPGNSAAVALCGVGQHSFAGTCISDLSGFQPPASITFTTFSMSCVIPTVGPLGATIVPVPTGTSVPPPTVTPIPPISITPVPITPGPGPTPAPTSEPKCKLKPKECLFGVDRATCTCKLFP